jgi:nucleotide-binding universal stress UspA family protein
MFKNILIPSDGSELSQHAFDIGIKLAKPLGARVIVFHMMEEYPAYKYPDAVLDSLPTVAAFREEQNRLADNILRQTRDLAAAAGVTFEGDSVSGIHPYQAILDAARKYGADLIVMASHGHRGLQALLIGSETSKVLTHARIPVMVCR